MTTLTARRTPTATQRHKPMLPRGPRRALLVAHLVTSIGWIGADFVLLALALTGLSTDDPELARASYTAVGIFVPVVIVPAALLSLATGVLLSVGTKWGLTRYVWIVVKLVITVALTIAVFVLLRPQAAQIVAEASEAGSAQRFLDGIGDARSGLLFPPVVSGTALLVATVVSIYKPWGMTRWGRRGS